MSIEQVAANIRELLVEGEAYGGDPNFYAITAEELELYDAKNRDYTGGTDNPNGNFERVSAILGMYPGLSLSDRRVVAITYAMKQLDQVLLSLSRGYEGAIEGLDSRLGDIHIYMKIVRAMNRGMSEEGEDEDAVLKKVLGILEDVVRKNVEDQEQVERIAGAIEDFNRECDCEGDCNAAKECNS